MFTFVILPRQTCKVIATQLLSLSSVTFATKNLFFKSSHTSLFCPSVRIYSTLQSGTLYTPNYKLYIQKNDQTISPFHDIPMFADEKKRIYNMIVEIPKWTNAKMEISTKERFNPIKQDMKKGKVRYVKNLFPYKGYIWNYGAIPQTWEDPDVIDQHTGEKGDGDPIDIIEIGHVVSPIGQVKQVKVLGVFALVDDGETDWKVVSIDVNDPLANKLNDIDDVRDVMPGLLEATHEWFAAYKMPGSDTAPNRFAFDGEAKGSGFANEVIRETHEHWKKLIFKEKENIHNLSCENTSVDISPYLVKGDVANSVTDDVTVATVPAELPDDIDVMYYLTEKEKKGE